LVSFNTPNTFSKYPFSKRKLLLSKWGEHGIERNEVMVRDEVKIHPVGAQFKKNWQAKNVAKSINLFMKINRKKFKIRVFLWV
jgi:hypothetical protein